MSEKNCCQLCGGALNQGYCPSCGFYAARNSRIHYRLNESNASRRLDARYGKKLEKQLERREKSHQRLHNDFKGTPTEVIKARREADARKKAMQQESINRGLKQTPSSGSVAGAAQGAFRSAQNAMGALTTEIDRKLHSGGNTNKIKGAQNTWTTGNNAYGRSHPQNTMQGKVAGRGLAIGVVAALVIAAAVVVYGEFSSRMPDNAWSDNSTPEPARYDPYQYEENTLPETGDDYAALLTGGEYIVGTHIPEGLYKVSLVEGSGSLNVEDSTNGASVYQWFEVVEEDDEDYGYVTELEDVRLFDGARVTVYPEAVLSLETQNAQTYKMSSRPNPLTESVYVQKGVTLTCGVDFAPGVYDVCDFSDDEVLFYTRPYYWSDDDELYDEILWLNATQGAAYKNLVLIEGAEIWSGYASFTLMPSSEIGNIDYDTYYDY